MKAESEYFPNLKKGVFFSFSEHIFWFEFDTSTLDEPLAVSVCESLSIDINLPERIRSLNGIYLISHGPTCGNVVPVLMTSVMGHLNNPSCENEFSKTKLKKLRKRKELAKFKFKHCNLAKFT